MTLSAQSQRALQAALAAVSVAYLFWFAGDGLASGFFPDEMMNLFWAWDRPWPRLLADLVAPGQGSYRPAGALLYRVLFETFGLNPLPSRLLCFALLAANLLLVGVVGRRLGGSAWIGIWAMALCAYQAYLSDLYHSTATVYELLCFFFSMSFLACWAAWRKTGIGCTRAAALWLLLTAAAGSKEIGVLLPASALLLEVLFSGGLAGERRRRLALLAGLGAWALLLGWLKFAGTSAFSGNAAYEFHFTLPVVVASLGHYGGMLFYLDRSMLPTECAVVLLALAGLAAFARDRLALFALAQAALSAAPVLLIAPRSLYAMYLPIAWLALAAAALLWRLPLRSPARAAAISVAILAVLAPLHARAKPTANHWIQRDGPIVTTLLEQLRARADTLPRGGRVLFLSDPVNLDDYLLTFVWRLYYADRHLVVDRVKLLRRCPTLPEFGSYARVYAYDGAQLIPRPAVPASCPTL